MKPNIKELQRDVERLTERCSENVAHFLERIVELEQAQAKWIERIARLEDRRCDHL